MLQRDAQFLFEKFEPLDQSRQAFPFAFVVKRAQSFVSFIFHSFAIRKLVSRKAFVVTRRARQDRGFREIFRRLSVVVVFVAVESGERFVKLRLIGIVFDPAFEKIFAEGEIFALRFHAQSKPRLRRIVHRGCARVPSHVPGGHVPKQWDMRLQSRDLSKQKQNASPFRPLPSHVRFNEQNIREHRAEAAQRRDEPELPNPFAQIEICHVGKFQLSLLTRERVLGRKFHYPKREEHCQREKNAAHNSFP